MLVQTEWSEQVSENSTLTAEKESELLAKYAYLVKRAGAHMRTQLGVIVDVDDIQQIGLVALLSSIRRYGRDVDEKFAAYAFKCIRGAMLDEFRRVDWRPRQLRQKSHKLRDCTRALVKRLGREPNDSELCAALKVSPDELLELHYITQAEAMDSLESLLDDGGQYCSPTDDTLSKAESAMELQAAMATLPARNKLLLQLYYTYEMNMKEIALTLELTEARVCQLHKEALVALTRKLKHSE
ncbi:FliA/WhiG family RNA polymerase sigma factor [Colwellia sp. 4_MG-2023]|jgi:RNA polymerase sigma factor for flagellar operon FliA|uniref:FliA/WhiG family RNA polymerase sigma factor n=1 Tax=unclassified Colwellia TaxID=196834 RepID=UPI001C0A2D37|nr:MULTISPECIES: FliA/WhiG family RNA polymerase sigma factor [unclassified Colwellia]MBU2926104.1 FliA/WhiG family RNA polymerase sigma factor [Colwellia sp. C2M11]MDO6487398.1 FliA/WhiG family RNA polymerase sigma factor [Colwellia sp. 6_MG-2023]MDO6508302.1 FliA/WhiG family RNA polymerase sigma factor [Colwellia sp. 5_MG-2023]MDO6556955.1 FliA/WhiG family RNA polymerase sigma factor [Colwellia sp. 4_MG-2023]MDO6652475.1 FliA/WhiG family RNA polymerase sigma factor [Colwellia sp. 3_MG-2023]